MPLHDEEMNRRREKREAQRRRQQAEAKRLKMTLALAAVVLLGSVVLHVSTAGGLEVRMNPRWEVRLDQLIRRNF